MSEMRYSREQIKEAFWKTFHEAGPVHFTADDSRKENEAATDHFWQEFQGYLEDQLSG